MCPYMRRLISGMNMTLGNLMMFKKKKDTILTEKEKVRGN